MIKKLLLWEFYRYNLYPVDEFEYDEENEIVTCPNGKIAADPWENKTGDKVFHFGRLCDGCPLRAECTTCEKGRSVTISAYYREFKEQEEYSKTDEYKKEMKQRAATTIEPKFGEQKQSHGLSRAIYWGLEKVMRQSILTDIAVNIKRLVTLLDGRTPDLMSSGAGLRVSGSVSSTP